MEQKKPKPKGEEKYRFTINLTLDVIEALRVRATRERKSVSRLIEEWVRSWKEVKK